MKKIALMIVCSLLMVLVYVASVNAEVTAYSRVKGGLCQIYGQAGSASMVYLTTTQSNISEYKQAYFLFRVPASVVGADDCLVIDSSGLGGFSAAFFWSSHDLSSSSFWSTSYKNGFASKSFSYSNGSSLFRLLTGDLQPSGAANRSDYEAGINVFRLPDGFRTTSGYLYISGITADLWDSSALQVSVMPFSEIPDPTPTPTPSPDPTPTPTPSPDPTPTPTPSPDPTPTATPSPDPTPTPFVPDFGGVSAELGTFGTDDGTQNGVFAAFKKLYDSLYDIVTDDSIPDMSVLQDDVPRTKGRIRACSPLRSASYDMPEVYSMAAYSSDVSGADEKVLMDKWRAEQYETIDIGASWNISPVSVEIAETSATLGEGYRDGNAYILHYQLHLPFRFIYSGHTGTAYSNPSVLFNLRIDYAGFPDYGRGTVQYGTPYIYVDNDGVSYDRYDDLEVNRSVISGDAGIAFLNIPVLDNLSQNSYDVVIDFPLYITDVNDPLVFANAFAYESTVTLNSLTYVQDAYFQHVSDATTDQTLQDIADEQKKQNELENERYEQEQEKTQETIDNVNSGVTEITGTLSSWEIFVLPVTVMKDFVLAITSSSDARLTFPSFSLMGQTLWPSYTFDLATVSEKFPLLCNTLHLISGILIVIWFLHYLWRKWSLITGDDLPEEG